ncbi:MAG: hypothetical protein ACYCW5_06655 [Thermoleophilia bacterium]
MNYMEEVEEMNVVDNPDEMGGEDSSRLKLYLVLAVLAVAVIILGSKKCKGSCGRGE